VFVVNKYIDALILIKIGRLWFVYLINLCFFYFSLKFVIVAVFVGLINGGAFDEQYFD